MKPNPKLPITALRQLAVRYGIQTEYQDIFGKRSVASAEALIGILQALHAPIARAEDIAAALHDHEVFTWRSGLDPVSVAWDGKLSNQTLRLEAARAQGRARCRIVFEGGLLQEWELNLEDLPVSETIALDGKRHVALRIPGKKMPPRLRLPMGYHRFQVECRAGGFDSLVIAAPPACYDAPEKAWGVFLPLYALHSKESWGAGDFSDLERLMQWVRAQGGSVVSTLPLLAAFLNQPYEISPYLPASRLFWNEMYVDPRRVPEFESCAAARSMVHSSFFERDLQSLRALPRADHRRIMSLKRPLLETMARWLESARSERTAAFEKYVAARPRLRDYARFRAASERQNVPWTAWPERLRNGRLRSTDYDPADERYHLYAQWIAEQQLEQLADSASGGAGLYLDLPLGVHPLSFDVWRNRHLFALRAATGAPPDSLFLGGQNWSFPPPIPSEMRQQGYEYFIACLRSQFRFTRWLRIDHVMGLHRLFWIPEGRPASEGVYVNYAAEELYAILAVESHRAKTTVVGENLGTVPPEVNRALKERGLKSMFVLQYEAQPDPKKCLQPVPPTAVASLNTHDMAPFAAFWDGGDIRELKEIGLLESKEAAKQTRYRKQVQAAVQEFFADGGVAKADTSKPARNATGTTLERALGWLAASKAAMVLVNLEDLWGETASQNVPGTSLELPNWQRKARMSIEEFASDPAITRTIQNIARLRNARPGKKK
jgi:4-alpha-glucanotransferase